MLRKVTYIPQQKYDLQKLLLLIVLMGFKLWFAINFDYFGQPFTDFHEIWRSFFNNTSQYCFTQEASQQNHFIYSLHCLFTWHSVVKWFCHVKNKSIWSYSVLMFCLSFNAICKKIYHINFLFYFWNVITHILMLCAFAKYAMCTIFHATIIYVSVLMLASYALFIQCKDLLEMYF